MNRHAAIIYRRWTTNAFCCWCCGELIAGSETCGRFGLMTQARVLRSARLRENSSGNCRVTIPPYERSGIINLKKNRTFARKVRSFCKRGSLIPGTQPYVCTKPYIMILNCLSQYKYTCLPLNYQKVPHRSFTATRLRSTINFY